MWNFGMNLIPLENHPVLVEIDNHGERRFMIACYRDGAWYDYEDTFNTACGLSFSYIEHPVICWMEIPTTKDII